MKRECGTAMPRAKVRCKLPMGHGGAHRSRVWYCDGCGFAQGGMPASSGPDYQYCIICTRTAVRDWAKRRRQGNDSDE